MKLTFCVLFILLSNSFILGQKANEKIKVILLGTFHYGATVDKGKTAFTDLFSKKRQSELYSIAQKLSKLGVSKFFLETQCSKQKTLDSLYAAYTAKKITDTIALRNEEIQIGFRTAQLCNAELIAADYKQELPYQTMTDYEESHKNDSINPYPFFDVAYPFTQKQKKLKDISLAQYYIQLNNIYNRQAVMYDYIHYALAYGVDTNYVGENFTASWYNRNLKIFTNILRNIDLSKDKVIVILFGSAHTAMLRHFFEDHPYFKIVELNEALH